MFALSGEWEDEREKRGLNSHLRGSSMEFEKFLERTKFKQ